MPAKQIIELGDTVKDTLTPFKGTAIGITKWISGCDRVTILPKELKDGMPKEAISLDITQVVVIKKAGVAKKKKIVKRKRVGGPHKGVSRNSEIQTLSSIYTSTSPSHRM